MVPNLYLYEKALEMHRQDLRHEMEVRRLLDQLPRKPGLSRQLAGKLGVLLLKLGMWLKQMEQPETAL
ncbi:MAG: hypothetical protein E6I59_14280 [Chloroflexi bacterium]|nr:MAG: hypothetical protein E6J31_13120 [Chloroflexota bacterium]TMC92063.1 MAG: hypothetical protein E6J22_10140 [Chloroflexota bacterium]TMC93210.1 MAG: hypothetical protein E6J11_17710 [Chloroflexota bacterium]TMD72437.1 MAG: hypothetical protein E6I97_17535 [Chloroflexota bacterium]TME60243.1 MAG: hypothetical protein E6I59_14280 [Chloroflexota bacterium]